MSRFRQFVVICLCAAIGASAIIPSFIRAEGPAATQAAKPARTMSDIKTDLDSTMTKLNELLPYPKLLSDAKYRKDNAEKVVPLLQQMAALLNELATTQNIPVAGSKRLQCLSMAVALGDKESAKVLGELAAGKNEEEAMDAKSNLVLGNWISASEDVATQQKILDEYNASAKVASKTYTDLSAERDAANAALAGKTPDDDAKKKAAERDAKIEKAVAAQDNMVDTLMVMSQVGPANADMAKKALEVIKTSLNSDSAKQAAAVAEADQAVQNLVGKPIKIAGRTTTNEQFTAANWKGKVVMVDFWATWCGPCRAALPEVQKLYQDYHAKGLEIVGVDCDGADDVVNAFTKAKDTLMPWPQLRELTQTDDDNWHPLAKKYGVDSIPRVFLIDKKGVLRYVDGREDTETKVKKLLEEPDAKPPEKAPPAK